MIKLLAKQTRELTPPLHVEDALHIVYFDQRHEFSSRRLIMPSEEESVTTFLNVDLDLQAQYGIEELLGYLGSSVIVLNQTEQFASIESTRSHSSPEETIRNLIELIHALPPEGRDIWNQCDYRRFNIGIEGGNEPHAAVFAISSEVVSLLAGIQAEITLTIYAPVSSGK